MPEYLSPGVFVEEQPGPKPIEGVSTSTAGFVGVTERGPANVPILVTSFGDFRRTFGGYLPYSDFYDSLEQRAHCYLPHAIEGFFVNGGKRAYVVRVTSEDATRADRRLFFDDPKAANPASTVLLHAAEEGTGTTLTPPLVYALSVAGLVKTDWIRIGDGSRSEYRNIVDFSASAPLHVTINVPLQQSFDAGTVVADITRNLNGVYTAPFLLNVAPKAGDTQIVVTPVAADLAALTAATNLLVEVGAPQATAEYVYVKSAVANGAQVTLTLSTPLQRSHAIVPASSAAVTALDPLLGSAPGKLAFPASAGDSIVYLQASQAPLFTDPSHLIIFDPSGTQPVVRRVGVLGGITLNLPAYEPYPAASLVESVALGNDDRTVLAGSTNTVINLDDVTGLVPGMQLVFGAVTGQVSTVVANAVPPSVVTLSAALSSGAPAPNSKVQVQPRSLAVPAEAGAHVITLNARIGLQPGDVLRLGPAPNCEYATIATVSDPRNAPLDPGTVVLERPLDNSWPVSSDVHRQGAAQLSATQQATYTLLDAAPGATTLYLSDASNFAAGNLIRVTLSSGDQYYHYVTGFPVLAPGPITLDLPLTRSHAAGTTLAMRNPLFTVRALDKGAWARRVMVTAQNEDVGLLARAEVTAATASPAPGIPSTMRLTTATAVEPGTILQINDPTDETQVGDFVKVRQIDRAANNLVVLDPPGLSAAHVAAFNAATAAGQRLVAHSREFRLQVLVQQPPSPAIPVRNEDLQDQEQFRQLSMDQRHSHYFERVLGATFSDGADVDDAGQPLRRSDRRSQGASSYVRVLDLATSDADRERIRLGPEALTDTLPSSLLRPARFRLGDGDSLAVPGDDSVPTMDDAMYVGTDDNEPVQRTGIYALKNVWDLSLIAAPGQSTAAVQQALIDQCESLLYRFAVLDAQGPSTDSIDDVQAQRQQFDTKYAALYHPWLTIPDPFPTNLQSIAQFPIPPSGHVLGIYARVDDDRGVHKAPANEIVNGMTGLTRYLNQGEQDLLNAYPVNVDVIRDFRPSFRGIRVWGARCITSDSDWKYVNVRRLMIFIEDSLNQGLQWAVFEPNAEELWGRVRRSVTNFLTTVWRNGALEGDTKDQAFYVKCDRTTMTDDDLDNGRLIVLIGVAPVKPAEFVIIRIGLWTADASS